jgi:monoamine oxidase
MQSTENKGKSIAIIGAGLAGLNCARLLKNMGYRVKVFEASCRVGGRVHTACHAHTEERIEFGAEFIANTHSKWLDLAKKYNLTLVDCKLKEPAFSPFFQPRKKFLCNFTEEIKDVTSLLQSLSQFSLLVGDPNEPWNDDKEIQALDNISLGHFLEQKQQEWKISEDVMTYFRSVYERENLVSIYEQSLLAALCRIRAGGGPDFWQNTRNLRCAEGNATLARLMAEEQDVLLEHEIQSIETEKNGIRLCFRNKARAEKREKRGLTGPVLFEFPELFDFVILAVPNACLKNIQIHPALPLHNYTVHTGNASKLVCQPVEGTKISDIQYRCESDIFGETWPTAIGFNVFLGYYQADRSDNILTEALQQLTPFKKEDYTFLRVDYGKLAFSCGGYSCPTVGQATHQLRYLNQIVERNSMAFAGEACDPGFFGSMEGALRSGETTALRVNRWLKKQQASFIYSPGQ